MELKLEAKTQFETIILEHLTQVVSEQLADKINGGKKTLDGCYRYIVSEAKKRQENGCAVMSSEEVFGLTIHYFEEDEIIEEEVKTKAPTAVVSHSKPVKETKPKQEEPQPQLSLFDLL